MTFVVLLAFIAFAILVFWLAIARSRRSAPRIGNGFSDAADPNASVARSQTNAVILSSSSTPPPERTGESDGTSPFSWGSGSSGGSSGDGGGSGGGG